MLTKSSPCVRRCEDDKFPEKEKQNKRKISRENQEEWEGESVHVKENRDEREREMREKETGHQTQEVTKEMQEQEVKKENDRRQEYKRGVKERERRKKKRGIQVPVSTKREKNTRDATWGEKTIRKKENDMRFCHRMKKTRKAGITMNLHLLSCESLFTVSLLC